MSNYRIKEIRGLFDYTTGEFIGVLSEKGREDIVPTATVAPGKGDVLRLSAGGKILPKASRILKPPQALPFNFSDIASYTVDNGTKSLDTTKYRAESRGTLKVVPSADAGCNVYKAITLTRGPMLPTDTLVGLWVYLDSGDEANGPANAYINVVLSSVSNFADALVLSYASTHLRWNQWNYLCMRLDEIGIYNASGTGTSGVIYYGTGQAALTIGIRNVQLNLVNMNGKSIYIDRLEYGLYSRPAISFGFDGISANIVSNIIPLLQQYNLPWFGCFNGNAGGITTAISMAKSCFNAGAEIINHGLGHVNLATLNTDDEIRTQIVDNWNMMSANGLVRTGQEKIFYYPANQTHPQAKRVLAEEGYVFARGYKNFNLAETPSGFDGLLEIGSFALENTTQKRMLEIVDAAVAYGGSIHLFAHDVNMTTPATGAIAGGLYIDDLTAVLKRLALLRDQGLVDLYTPSEWYQQVASRYL